MKRLLCFLLVSIFALSVFSSCNAPEGTSEAWPEANPAHEFAYELMSEDTAVLIRSYIGTSKRVVIPAEIEGKPVIAINPGLAFQDPWLAVEELYIPSSVQYIGIDAFSAVNWLRCVYFEERDEQIMIAPSAFFECEGLEKMVLPQHAVLQNSSFDRCSNLKEVFIPNTVVFQGWGIFEGCSSLEKVVFEDGITSLDVDAPFYYSRKLKNITIPASVSEISDALFSYCVGLETVTFLGDAPELLGDDGTSAQLKTNTTPASQQEGVRVTIYYDPATKGWDTFAYDAEAYVLVPLPAAES